MAENYQVMEELGSTLRLWFKNSIGLQCNRRELRKGVQSCRPADGRDRCHQTRARIPSDFR